LLKTQVLPSACNSNYSGGRDQEDHGSKPAQGHSSKDPILKIPNIKKAGGVAQVVEHLSSKCEALSSNSNTEEKKNHRC
jgi:hypothetical protein